MDLGVTINREIDTRSCSLKQIFVGFENVKAVRAIFGAKTIETLERINVVLEPRKGYLHVDDSTGNIIISTPYLKSGDERYLYLDVIHELVHVRQYIEGKELFDKRYSYVDRPTEIEAYSIAVKEAKRIGMTETEIVEYLKVDWVSKDEFKRMLTNLGMGAKSSGS